MTRQELMNECDMLKGNINRMMVTDDVKELRSMYDWACKRLSRIQNERYQKLVVEDIKAEIQKPLNEERFFDTDNAKAQAIALRWCLDIIDKHTKEVNQ